MLNPYYSQSSLPTKRLSISFSIDVLSSDDERTFFSTASLLEVNYDDSSSDDDDVRVKEKSLIN